MPIFFRHPQCEPNTNLGPHLARVLSVCHLFYTHLLTKWSQLMNIYFVCFSISILVLLLQYSLYSYRCCISIWLCNFTALSTKTSNFTYLVLKFISLVLLIGGNKYWNTTFFYPYSWNSCNIRFCSWEDSKWQIWLREVGKWIL